MSSALALRHVLMIVKPFKAEAVIEALRAFPVEDLIIYECRGYGRQKGHLELYSGPEYSISFLPKVAIEFGASHFILEELLDAVMPVARTGRIGDGKVFIFPIAEEV